jgi:hypothetical protein
MGQESLDTNRLPLLLLRRIDEVCLRFEDRWLAGERPDLDAFLTSFAEAEQTALMPQLLLLEWDYLFRRGESFFLEEYGRRFPALRPVVEQAWQRWKALGRGASTTGIPPASPGGSGEPSAAVLPGYEQVTPLDSGGMGEVCKAYEPGLDRWVALKRVRLDRTTPDRLRRFAIEARTLAQFQHPHIVQLFACAESGGQPVVVMEYVAGGTLEQRLNRPLPWAEAARLVAVLAWAVHAAHEKGIVHRDLKPANVLMAGAVEGSGDNVLGGYPKIADFGLASLTGASGELTVSGDVIGTPEYMAPEQAAGRTREVGPKADVWALGVILYRCLSGALPFKGDSVLDTLERIKTMQMRPLHEARPGVPEALAAACLACLRKDAEQRPAAAELAVVLDRCLACFSEPTVDFVARPVRSPRQRIVWGGVLAGAAVLAVIVVLVLAGWWTRERGKEEFAGGDGPAEGLAPPHVKMTVRVFDKANPTRKPWPAIDREGALPVRAGELVRAEVELDRPAHCYLLLLSSQGEVVPLYPWNEAKLKVKDVDAPPGGKAVRKWSSPTLPEMGWKADRNAGLETLLLLVRDEPLPAGYKLRQLLGEVPAGKRAPLRNPREAAVLELDRDESVESLLSQGRGFDEEAEAVDEPLVALMRRAREVFPVVRAVRFAHTAD